MPRLYFAAGALVLASIAFAQQIRPIRYLMPLARYGHYAGGEPKLIAENLRNHGKYLEGSVEELVRYVKSDPELDAETRKTADDILKWCREEKKLIDEDASRIGGDEKASAVPAEKRDGFMKEAPKAPPAEPRFE